MKTGSLSSFTIFTAQNKSSFDFAIKKYLAGPPILNVVWFFNGIFFWTSGNSFSIFLKFGLPYYPSDKKKFIFILVAGPTTPVPENSPRGAKISTLYFS